MDRCIHCRRCKIRYRGLCWGCGKNPALFDLYPRKLSVLSRHEPHGPVPKMPENPTDARPGSEQKIQVMNQRFARGEAVFHPDDLTTEDLDYEERI